MLVLSRRDGERILMRNDATGEVITVTITQVNRGRVRVGIEASREWVIAREEVATWARDKSKS